jgi:Tat protein secretion system quality control protein TatD with DNase activity
MYTAKKLSELLSISPKELSDITIANTNKLMEK